LLIDLYLGLVQCIEFVKPRVGKQELQAASSQLTHLTSLQQLLDLGQQMAQEWHSVLSANILHT